MIHDSTSRRGNWNFGLLKIGNLCFMKRQTIIFTEKQSSGVVQSHNYRRLIRPVKDCPPVISSPLPSNPSREVQDTSHQVQRMKVSTNANNTPHRSVLRLLFTETYYSIIPCSRITYTVIRIMFSLYLEIFPYHIWTCVHRLHIFPLYGSWNDWIILSYSVYEPTIR